MTRGFKLLYGIDAEDALLLLFADEVMYFQEKVAFKVPRKSISFSMLPTPDILCSSRDDDSIPRMSRMVYAQSKTVRILFIGETYRIPAFHKIKHSYTLATEHKLKP